MDSILNEIADEDIRIPLTYVCKISKDNLLRQLKIVSLLKKSSNQSASSSTSDKPRSNTESKKMDPSSLKRGLLNYKEYILKRSKGDILTKIQHSEPYRFFLSAIAAESKTHDDMLSVSFPGKFSIL